MMRIAEKLDVPDLAVMSKWPDDMKEIVWAGKPGLFILRRGSRFELWNMREGRIIQLLHDEETVYHCSVQDDLVYLLTSSEVFILEHALRVSRDECAGA